jgi:hypothetical protein
MGQTDLMSVGANPLQNTRIPSALTALLAAVAMDIRPGTLPVESGCTDWIRVLRTSNGKVACEEIARFYRVRENGVDQPKRVFVLNYEPTRHIRKVSMRAPDSPSMRPSPPTHPLTSTRPNSARSSPPRPLGSGCRVRHRVRVHVHVYGL